MAIAQGGGVKLFGTTIGGFDASAAHVAGGPAASGPMPFGAHRAQQPTTSNISQIADALLKSEQRGGTSGGTSDNSSDTQQTACTASSPQASPERQAATAAQASVFRQATHDGLRADSFAALRDAAEALQVLQRQPSAGEALPPQQPAAADSVPLALAAGPLAPPARVGESTAERQSRRRTSVQIQAQLPPNLKLCSSCRQVKPHAMYHQCKAKRDGLQDRCKACRAELDRQRLLLARSGPGGGPPPAARAAGASRSSSAASSSGKRSRSGSVQAGASAFADAMPQHSAPPSFAEPPPLDLAAKRRRFPHWGGAEAQPAPSAAPPPQQSAAAVEEHGWAVPKARRTARRASAPVAPAARWQSTAAMPSRMSPHAFQPLPPTAELQLTQDELLKGRRIMFAAVAGVARITTVPALRSFLAALGKPAAQLALLQWSGKQMLLAQERPSRLVRPMVRRHSCTPTALPPAFAAAGGGGGLFPIGSVPAAVRGTSAFAAC